MKQTIQQAMQQTARRGLLPWAITTALLSMSGANALAATASIAGKVATSDGRPISGALVTLWNEAGDRKETV